jgi:hypothetical protein
VSGRNRLRWVIVLPSVAPGAHRERSPVDGVERLDPSHWMAATDDLSQRAPGSFSLILETLDRSGRTPNPAFWLRERDLLPTAIVVNRTGPGGAPVDEFTLDDDLELGRIVSGFDVNALFLATGIGDADLERLQRLGMETAIRNVTVTTGAESEPMTDWALRIMRHVFGPPLDSAMRPRAEVHLEIVVDEGAPSMSAVIEQQGPEPQGTEQRLQVAWSTWGIVVAPRGEGAAISEDAQLGLLVRDLQEVHALARLQQWHLLELSSAINSDRVRTTASNGTAGSRRTARWRRRHATATAVEDALIDHLRELRSRYLTLLQSGIFSYVNRVPLAQTLYDGVREQVRLEETHREVRLELDLLGAHVDTRMRERGLQQDRSFNRSIKVWGAFIAVTSMVGTLLQLLTEETRVFGCGRLTTERASPILDVVDAGLCRGFGTWLVALVLGYVAYLVVRVLTERP